MLVNWSRTTPSTFYVRLCARTSLGILSFFRPYIRVSDFFWPLATCASSSSIQDQFQTHARAILVPLSPSTTLASSNEMPVFNIITRRCKVSLLLFVQIILLAKRHAFIHQPPSIFHLDWIALHFKNQKRTFEEKQAWTRFVKLEQVKPGCPCANLGPQGSLVAFLIVSDENLSLTAGPRIQHQCHTSSFVSFRFVTFIYVPVPVPRIVYAYTGYAND